MCRCECCVCVGVEGECVSVRACVRVSVCVVGGWVGEWVDGWVSVCVGE